MPTVDYQTLVTRYVQPYAGQFMGDPQFLQIVASGAKAESGWNTDSQQVSGANVGGKGLFQFDLATNAMGGSYKSNWQVLLGDSGAQLEASQIVPIYARYYAQGTQMGLTGQHLATYVIGGAERPQGYTEGAVSWNSAQHTWENYVSAWNAVMASPGTNINVGTSGVVTGPGGAIIQVPTLPGSPSTPQQNPGGTTAPPAQTQPKQVTVPVLTGTAGQIQAGLLGAFQGFMGHFGSGLVLILASIFAILIGAIIWNGDKVKKYAPEVAVTAAAA